MREVIGLERQVIVHHGADFGHIQSAGSQVSADEHAGTTGSELVECLFAHGLLHAAVVRFSSKAFVSQVAAYAFRTLTVCYEDNGLFVA